MIQTIELLPGVTLRCFRDHRFKQGALSFQIIRPMCREEAALNALIPTVLLRGTEAHPDLRAITLRLDDLYGAAVGATVRRVGDYQTTGLTCGFMEDKYALPGDQVLAPMMAFLAEILRQPALEDGGFRRDYVDSEKKNLISTIESERNDKRVYAMNQLIRSMCDGDSYGIARLGTVEDVEKIDPVCAYRHYQKILRTSRIDIFYVGSAPAETVAALLEPIFEGLEREYSPLMPQSALRPAEKRDLEETMEVSQGKLCLGYTTPITNRDPQFAAMQVMNTIFGAGMTSKLFMNVREKLSLCYSIGSGYYGSKGIITVSAGIDFDKECQTREEIARQLEAICRGDVTAQELNAAKEAILSSLRGTHDSPGAIEGYYATAALSGMGMTPQAYMQAVRAVTAEEVAQAARTVQLHSTYFLKGATA